MTKKKEDYKEKRKAPRIATVASLLAMTK